MLAAGTTLGPYKILAPLGAGGMGEVYRARDTRLARDVALKVVRGDLARDPERHRRFELEARAAGALNHPNVCTIFDVGTHEGAPFVVMELLEGESLREKLGAGPIPLRKALDWAAQAARGLAAAHEKGIVHRDLKPENLFVTKDGRVKVLDFGLAKLVRPEGPANAGDATQSMALTESGAILGTAGYMSPEQVRGQAVDARTDLFALGAIVHEMASGKRAFTGASFVEAGHAILTAEPAPLATLRPDAPPALESLVRHCLEKDPAQRFQSARDLAFALEALDAPGAQTSARPPAQRRGAATIAAAVAVVLLGIAAGYALRARTAPRAPAPSFARLTFHRGTIFDARFVPNDRSIVYGASWEGNPAQAYSVIPGSAESRALTTEGASLLGISVTGEMALKLRPRRLNPTVSIGTLATAPFAGGTPREVLEDVTAADWSPDGKTLAVVRRIDGQDRLEFPAGNVLHQTAGWISNVRISPRGDRIAFIDHARGGDDEGTIAIVDVNRRKMTTLTGALGGAMGLAWSPRGDEVWFTAVKGAKASALFAVTPSGRERLVLCEVGPLALHDIAPDGRVLMSQDQAQIGLIGYERAMGKERDFSWLGWPLAADLSADGKTLLFTEMSNEVEGGYAVYRRSTDGSPAVRLGEGWAEGLSADGKWVLAMGQDSVPALLMLPTGVGSPRKLPRGRIVNFLWASLFPDGQRVLMAAEEKGSAPRLYVQDVQGGEPRVIASDDIAGGHYWNPISPDGRWACLPSARGGFAVRSLDSASAMPRARIGPGEFAIRWTRDARGLYVFTENGRRAIIERLELATGRRTPVRALEPQDPAGLIHLGPVLLTPDADGYLYNSFRVLSSLYVVEGLK